MDKSWINLNERSSFEYVQGVGRFLEFAFRNKSKGGKILCPCRKCVNAKELDYDDVLNHLICEGFLRSYTFWNLHGEEKISLDVNQEANAEDFGFQNDMRGMLEDAFQEVRMEGESGFHSESGESREQSRDNFRGTSTNFCKLLKEADNKLYPNCPESRLATIVHLYHLKCLNGWSNKSFTQLLKYLKYLLPTGNLFPQSHYEVKTLMKDIGLGYERILACPNDCMLFWKDKENDEICSICGASKYLPLQDDEENSSDEVLAKRKRRPAKVLRWFPLIPRLQRLFMCSKTAALMRWHDESRAQDGDLRHPADSAAWKQFDKDNPDFAMDPRNVRLGLAADGFNPFKNMNVTHSTWPVIIIPYNLPPWVCMKESNFVLSLLIPGPKGPGNNIDVYLQPLIEELKELWEHGVETFDASLNESFKMRAALLWTINDYPALSILSGWSTKGGKACLCCGYETRSLWLENSHKYCYMGHRRWLPQNHDFRDDEASFDGTTEYQGAPPRMTGSEILNNAVNIGVGPQQPLKKVSIFYTLPYWEKNLLKHNIDVMHTEKNVYDNTFGTTFGQDRKTKDNYKARCDLVKLGIRSELHPKPKLGSKKMKLPTACYQMVLKEKDAFLKVLKEMVVPDEYSCNIPHCVQTKQRKIIGLKTYDCHILMQELFTVAVRGSLPKKVVSVLVDLSHLFKCLCAKVLKVSELDKLQQQAALILCEMEKIFPPSFFTIMVHLVVHLVEEAKLGGPVFYRWMYPVERFLLTLKNLVKN